MGEVRPSVDGPPLPYHERAQIPYLDICGLVLAHDTKIWGFNTPMLALLQPTPYTGAFNDH